MPAADSTCLTICPNSGLLLLLPQCSVPTGLHCSWCDQLCLSLQAGQRVFTIPGPSSLEQKAWSKQPLPSWRRMGVTLVSWAGLHHASQPYILRPQFRLRHIDRGHWKIIFHFQTQAPDVAVTSKRVCGSRFSSQSRRFWYTHYPLLFSICLFVSRHHLLRVRDVCAWQGSCSQARVYNFFWNLSLIRRTKRVLAEADRYKRGKS